MTSSKNPGSPTSGKSGLFFAVLPSRQVSVDSSRRKTNDGRVEREGAHDEPTATSRLDFKSASAGS
jgi:hypothetical protein